MTDDPDPGDRPDTDDGAVADDGDDADDGAVAGPGSDGGSRDDGGTHDDGGDLASVTAGFETVRADREGDVVTVTLDRPEARNAMNAQLRRELKTTLDAVEDSDARVVVLTGSPDSGAFVAGADVGELRDRSGIEQRRVGERPRVYEYVDDLRQPVIAKVNGHALGGGCELAQACDVRVASADAKLGQPEIGLGLIPGGGATQRLPRLVGEGQAMKLVLTGELIDAAEAADVGLVEEVCPPGKLDDRVDELAASMAEHSPVALELAKSAVKAGSRMGLEEGIEYEAELFAHLFDTHDMREGIDAFFEDRDPEFEGR